MDGWTDGKEDKQELMSKSATGETVMCVRKDVGYNDQERWIQEEP